MLSQVNTMYYIILSTNLIGKLKKILLSSQEQDLSSSRIETVLSLNVKCWTNCWHYIQYIKSWTIIILKYGNSNIQFYLLVMHTSFHYLQFLKFNMSKGIILHRHDPIVAQVTAKQNLENVRKIINCKQNCSGCEIIHIWCLLSGAALLIMHWGENSNQEY